MILATELGQQEILSLLLDSGADIEAKKANGYTSLMIAASSAPIEIVSLLLEHGADIRTQGPDEFPIDALILALQNLRTDVVSLLLDHGATLDEECQDEDLWDFPPELTTLLSNSIRWTSRKNFLIFLLSQDPSTNFSQCHSRFHFLHLNTVINLEEMKREVFEFL